MSIEARQKIVQSPNTIFQNDSQRTDIMDTAITKTELIAQIQWLLDKDHKIEFTAIKTDHGPDACLGLHSHQNGYAFDCWPLVTNTPGDYADAASPQMAAFIRDIMTLSPWTYQCGLAGSAQTDELCAAAGFPGGFPDPKVTNRLFADDGADHVHVGCKFQ